MSTYDIYFIISLLSKHITRQIYKLCNYVKIERHKHVQLNSGNSWVHCAMCLNKLRFDKEEKSEENSARVKLYELHFLPCLLSGATSLFHLFKNKAFAHRMLAY